MEIKSDVPDSTLSLAMMVGGLKIFADFSYAKRGRQPSDMAAVVPF